MAIKQTEENYFLDKNAGGKCCMADWVLLEMQLKCY